MEIATCSVRLFQHEAEITCDDGVRTIFSKDGNDVSSSTAVWRIRKLSDTRVVCFLKWPKPLDVFQVWYFSLSPDGTVELEILSRAKDLLLTRNERVECGAKGERGILGEEIWGNKAKVFSFGKSGVRFETLDDNKICEISPQGPYFLTVRDYDEKGSSDKEKRRSYFKGRFYSGDKTSLSLREVSPAHKLESGRSQILFREGSCQLLWEQKALTVGFGLYTAYYSQGMWFDSTRAIWKVEKVAKDRLLVKSFWPWRPISQTWEIVLKNEKNIFLSFAMRVQKDTPISMQETVLMLNENYKRWRADKEIQAFPKEFTTGDLFRMCPWAAAVDGKRSISALSGELPTVTFQPLEAEGHRIVVENAAHIRGTRCRLFHCLRENKEKKVMFPAGDYELFKGSITIHEEEKLC